MIFESQFNKFSIFFVCVCVRWCLIRCLVGVLCVLWRYDWNSAPRRFSHVYHCTLSLLSLSVSLSSSITLYVPQIFLSFFMLSLSLYLLLSLCLSPCLSLSRSLYTFAFNCTRFKCLIYFTKIIFIDVLVDSIRQRTKTNIVVVRPVYVVYRENCVNRNWKATK